MIEITLTGNPLSTQHIYKYFCRGRFGGFYMSKKGKDAKARYKEEIKEQYKGEPMEQDVEMYVKLFFGTKRKVDVDNFSKLVNDALSELVYVDDVQIKKLTTEKFYDKENPHIEIVIRQKADI